MKLNPAQNDAVHYVSGPCLVLAGAGDVYQQSGARDEGAGRTVYGA